MNIVNVKVGTPSQVNAKVGNPLQVNAQMKDVNINIVGGGGTLKGTHDGAGNVTLSTTGGKLTATSNNDGDVVLKL